MIRCGGADASGCEAMSFADGDGRWCCSGKTLESFNPCLSRTSVARSSFRTSLAQS